MTRLASSLDRFVALIAGAALIAIGAALVLWDTAVLPNVPRTVNVPGLRAATATGWWSWALAGVGILLIVAALRWLFTHTPAARVTHLPLLTNDSGAIGIDLGEVAHAAAHALEQSPDVDSVSGKAIIDRGTRTVDLTVNAVAAPRPEWLIPAIDAVCEQIVTMLAEPTIASRTTIHVGKGQRRRVR
ncbi:alkaline shock response membrane anchor protein AmaP [Mycolicibacterium hodleri]|uniref:Alkaline shock response membrane anchor protein AmaP n=1 Tax=Mycolicibacterium hodleri TaxID=49897 RepID=A0A502E7S9_9MYCO|nr:alkaline shock response membrane anchor protein AmaP [Mycolicibacterium hodleri]TPG33029.1 alkaline shock response membrane anchor protein AmaP [Mycolicibacterium hodleri]